jgi:PilZ domain
MSPAQQGRRNRAPRVNIPHRESAQIDIGGKQLTSVLCKLSINGGALRLSKPFGESTLAEITLQTTSGTIGSAIQFLKVGSDGVQGFRFLQLDAATRSKLETALRQMRKQGLGDEPRSVIELCTNAARRVMQKAKTQINGA